MTAYCQQFGIGSRVASFLVLENEADYKRLNLEESAARSLRATWASSSMRRGQYSGALLSARESFERFLRQVDTS